MGKGKKGFTLVELTIVIAVIAILAAVTIPTFAVVIGNANKSADLQTLIDLNRMLFGGEIEVESLKEIKLKTQKWELAYSRNENVLVIVDDEDIIVEPETSIFLGKKISETKNYVRVSELAFDEPGSGDEHKGEVTTAVKAAIQVVTAAKVAMNTKAAVETKVKAVGMSPAAVVAAKAKAVGMSPAAVVAAKAKAATVVASPAMSREAKVKVIKSPKTGGMK